MIATSRAESAPLRETLYIDAPGGVTVQCDRYGEGPPLVLVHGSFSDHVTNWTYVADALAERFTIHAVARRGRGATDATEDHDVADEGRDVAAVIRAVGEPVFLLGHSYGAQVALAAAAEAPTLVRKLVLYEPPLPEGDDPELTARLDQYARRRDWDGLADTFFDEYLSVPREELNALKQSPDWPPIVADAEATLGDFQGLADYDFDAERFRHLDFPVVLQVGSESPREPFATDRLAAVLPDVRIEVLEGQAHDGMTTGPAQYASAVRRIFLA